MKSRERRTGLLLLVLLCLLLSACRRELTQKAVYRLELSGAVEEAGVIRYAGLEMNVYPDQQSNPCGTCADQPVSVLAGATAEEVAEAMAQAIRRADDLWVVQSIERGVLVLEERELGQATPPAEPEAPGGLSVTGTYQGAR